jgi:1,2-diacylglycerol 3-alpha-glucosyltransferase
MKVLHVCLASFYIDNYSYQENMLPKYHKKLGIEVEILASLVSFDKNGNSCLLERGSVYRNEFDIPVTRLEYKNSIIGKRLRQYKGTYNAIVKAKPDIIFIHGCQFVDIEHIVKYVKENPEIKVYVDNHADFSNSATNWLSKYVLHKMIWKYCAHLINPFTNKFYGVLPARVDFLRDVYKLPIEKIELLLMGADDDKVKEVKSNNDVRNSIRAKYNVNNDDFLIVTGGKVDQAKKQILLLMKAVKELDRSNVKLIVFGSVIEELQSELKSLCDDQKIQYIGWIKSEESYRYFASADLAVFPGRHSVLWEQVVGMGVPCIFKYWDGTTHVDVGGNCKFLYDDSVGEIKSNINDILNDEKLYDNMITSARNNGMRIFSYHNIANKSIQLTNEE